MTPQTPLTQPAIEAGVGKARIVLDTVLPFDGFSSVRDALHARVLLMRGPQESHAIVSLEVPSLRPDAVERLRGTVGTELALPEDRIWIVATHTLSAPHTRSATAQRDPEVAARNALWIRALETACASASHDAAQSLQPCVVAGARAKARLNVNRDELHEGSWSHGAAPERFSDPTVAVLRIDSLDGSRLATVFGHDVRSSVTEQAAHLAGEASADCTGAAAAALEESDGGVALFLPGAMADQDPLTADADADAYTLASRWGASLAAVVSDAASHLICHSTASLSLQTGTVPCTTAEGGTDPLDVAVLRLGPASWVGMRPELSSVLGAAIRGASPDHATFVVSMVNGGAKQVVDGAAHAAGTLTAQRSPFDASAGDMIVAEATRLLARTTDGRSAA